MNGIAARLFAGRYDGPIPELFSWYMRTVKTGELATVLNVPHEQVGQMLANDVDRLLEILDAHKVAKQIDFENRMKALANG